MTVERKTGWRIALLFEALLAAVVAAALCKMALFYFQNDYLPAPFVYDRSDTFMDWYNSVYWAHNAGAYDEWLSVYPPLSFDFLRIFSIPSCYIVDSFAGRACDPVGRWALLAFFLINLPLVYFCYRKRDRQTAAMRTFALGAGIPMLMAWERGNIIIPCFTFFVLGHGRLLRSVWLKWVCIAMTINFKPYLLLAVVGQVLRGRWRWLEGCAIVSVILYLLSYILEGAGSPSELVRNIYLFNLHVTTSSTFNNIFYSSSYGTILKLLKSTFPIMRYIGSRPMDLMASVLPVLIRCGQVGVLTCFAGAVWRRDALSNYRLAGLAMGLLLTTTNPGGYAEVFLLFFVFFEQWRGFGRIVALVAGYILSVPWDFILVKIAHQIVFSYMSNRTVGYDLGVTLGSVTRPGLVLIVEYGLIAASLADLWRAAPSRPLGPSRSGPIAPRLPSAGAIGA